MPVAGRPSLFVYCTRVLHLSEHAAYGRIAAARAGRRLPTILEMLQRGELTLTSIGLLAPHLTINNHFEVLARAKHRSRREVEELVASLQPKPDAPETVRRIQALQPATLATHGPKPPAASGPSVVSDLERCCALRPLRTLHETRRPICSRQRTGPGRWSSCKPFIVAALVAPAFLRRAARVDPDVALRHL